MNYSNHLMKGPWLKRTKYSITFLGHTQNQPRMHGIWKAWTSKWPQTYSLPAIFTFLSNSSKIMSKGLVLSIWYNLTAGWSNYYLRWKHTSGNKMPFSMTSDLMTSDIYWNQHKYKRTRVFIKPFTKYSALTAEFQTLSMVQPGGKRRKISWC